MTAPAGAVFLSYASEDSDAVQRIADALMQAGVEVWFDRRELRGGDTWDRTIREQIRGCRLFVPVISAQTEGRDEGYFRREWNLAADRMQDMRDGKAFVLPVAIDEVREARASVPDRFRQVQWVRLPGGIASDVFVTRVVGLLGGPDVTANVAAEVRSDELTAGANTRGRVFWLATCATLACALATVMLLRGRGPATDAREALPPPSAAQAPAAAIEEHSIAVLPFVDLSEKHDKEYFGDGLADELIDLLTRVPGLSVVARTSAFHFKNSSASLSEIGKSLAVAYVLEGSVRQAESKFRITAQLVRTSDARPVFSRTYERSTADIFKVQDDIAREVLAVLRVALTDVPRVRSSTTWNAYQTYLEGKFSNSSLADTEKSVAAFRSALAIDENFAPAWAALAYELTNEADSYGANPTKIYSEARQAAQRAMQLDPTLVEGYLALAYIEAAYDYNWEGANRLVQQAARLEPGNPHVMRVMGNNDQYRGEWLGAIESARRSIARDPLSPEAHAALAVSLYCGERLVDAEAEFRRSLELDPQGGIVRSNLGLDLMLQRRYTEALQVAGQDPNEAYRLWSIAQIQHAMGSEADSRASLKEYMRRYPTGNADGVAWIYAAQGRLDEAFEWFDKAFKEHNQGLTYIKCMPAAPPVTKDPRYGALLRRLNLPE